MSAAPAAMLMAAVISLAGSATTLRAETFEFAVWYSDRDFYADQDRTVIPGFGKGTQGRVKINLHFSGALTETTAGVIKVPGGAVGGGTTSASFVAGLV